MTSYPLGIPISVSTMACAMTSEVRRTHVVSTKDVAVLLLTVGFALNTRSRVFVFVWYSTST